MIPRTFPSTFASNGQQQMVVHFLTSVEGLARWSDYIPVKLAQGGPENSYSGCIDVVAISELTADTQAWKEYIPVYADSSATDAWTVNSVGYIPYNYALFADAAMQLDLTNGAALDPRITFSRTTNATLTNSAGLIANAPMNLLTFSEQFDNAAWTKGGATVTANNAAAPNATVTAETLDEGTTSAVHQVSQLATLTARVPYAFSAYFKNVDRRFVILAASTGMNEWASAKFDLVNGTVASSQAAGDGWSVSSTAIRNTGNGWYRCTIVFVASATGATVRAGMGSDGTTYTAAERGLEVYTGSNMMVHLWGAQLELGSTATTYNPTTIKNLLGFTENFDNAAWTKSNASITSGFTDIYGQPFAQKLVENTTTGVHSLIRPITPITSTPYTGTLYVKAAERAFAFVGLGQSGNFNFASIDLSTGAVSVASGSPTVSATSIGNGWFRVSVTVTPISTANLNLEVRVSTDGVWDNRSYTGDGTSGIYIFGAQLSDSASVDPYVYQPVAAPTSTAYYGPRFDYGPVTLAPKGLLIEEQRTNLLTYSEQFDDASWTKAAATISANSVAAPDGTITADALVEDTSTAQHWVFKVAGSAAAHSFSVYLKAASRTWAALRVSLTGPVVSYAWFDLDSGTVGTVQAGLSATITPVGNDWYRCTISGTLAGSIPVLVAAATGDNTIAAYTGNGTSAIYIWGAQLEAGSFATSYIPTVASQVTRAADSASMIGNNFARWFTSPNAYSVYAEYIFAGDTTGVVSTIDAGQVIASANDFSALPFTAAGGGSIQPTIRSGGVVQAFNVFSGLVVGTSYKTAYAVTTNGFNASNNGTLGTEDTSVTMPALPSTLTFGLSYNYGQGTLWLKRFAGYSRVLARSELQAITS